MSIKNFASYGDLESVLPSYANAIKEKAEKDMVADAFDATATYAEGDYCTYEGGLYKFKASHSGAWDAADVDRIKIAGELSELKNTLMPEYISDTGISEVYGNKLGNVVTLRFVRYSEVTSTTTAGWKKIGTLQSGLRPQNTVYALIYDNLAGSRATTPIQLKIDTSGDVSIYLFANDSAKPYGTVTYFV